jgi:sec-independent protein translocase protein TatB
MFDIGFWELSLIAVMALLVFGPERLPELARSAGLWIGRIRRYLSTIKQDMDRELRLQEWQQAMKLEEHNNFHQIVEETKQSLNPATDALATKTPNIAEKSDSPS